MIDGRFFAIPESPADLDILRQSAQSLTRATCPGWLPEAEMNCYRYLGRRAAPEDERERVVFRSEVEQLELAGLVVTPDARHPSVHHAYISSTSPYDVWSIGIYTGPSPLDLRPQGDSSSPVLTRKDVTDVPAYLVADPFMVRCQNTYFMFFELLNWLSNKGEIGLAASSNGFDWCYQGRVLVEPYHLSYPHVFSSDGNWYMVPETRQSHDVRLYRATDFPVGWTLESILIDDCDLVDSTLFQKDEHWWMLSGGCGEAGCTDLRLFRATTLAGPWSEHPASPVISGNRRIARPAGPVVEYQQQLVRFAQNCTTTYGLDVRAFGISELQTTSYAERQLRPGPILQAGNCGWNSGGMHHLDPHRRDDGSWIACVDGWTPALA